MVHVYYLSYLDACIFVYVWNQNEFNGIRSYIELNQF